MTVAQATIFRNIRPHSGFERFDMSAHPFLSGRIDGQSRRSRSSKAFPVIVRD
jgi:hypothetical protein